jgi:hypothetical protein
MMPLRRVAAPVSRKGCTSSGDSYTEDDWLRNYFDQTVKCRWNELDGHRIGSVHLQNCAMTNESADVFKLPAVQLELFLAPSQHSDNVNGVSGSLWHRSQPCFLHARLTNSTGAH